MTIYATLCYLVQGDKVLLQKKAKGKFGENKYNAPGGKMQPGETPEDCIKREILEETGLILTDCRSHGVVHHYLPNQTEPEWTVYIFSAEKFSGTLKPEDREGTLEWIAKNDLPFQQMWEDDRHWVPLLLSGKSLEGSFYFTENWGKIIRQEIKIIKTE